MGLCPKEEILRFCALPGLSECFVPTFCTIYQAKNMLTHPNFTFACIVEHNVDKSRLL